MEMKTSHRFPLLMDRSLPVLRPSAGGGGLGYSSVQLVQITEESMRKMKRMKGTWRRNSRPQCLGRPDSTEEAARPSICLPRPAHEESRAVLLFHDAPVSSVIDSLTTQTSYDNNKQSGGRGEQHDSQRQHLNTLGPEISCSLSSLMLQLHPVELVWGF
ncbi:unnamed protein product [Gadus morhua 'NCC']